MGDHSTGKSVQLPGHHGDRRVATLDMTELDDVGYTHVIVHTPADSGPSHINIDVFSNNDRELVYSTPNWILGLFGNQLVEKTTEGISNS